MDGDLRRIGKDRFELKERRKRNMKKEYMNPELEMHEFAIQDIVTTSGDENEIPWEDGD